MKGKETTEKGKKRPIRSRLLLLVRRQILGYCKDMTTTGGTDEKWAFKTGTAYYF